MADINTTETTTTPADADPCVSGIKVGDLVTFGRPNGQRTEGRVIRVNPVSITVEQTEQRGVVKVREAGTKWRLHPSLVQLVGEEKPLVPVTTGVRVKPPIALKDKRVSPSRSESEIINDIRAVENCLSYSPSSSGSSSGGGKDVKAAAKRLNAQRAALIKELGREPSYQEVWGVPEFGEFGESSSNETPNLELVHG